MEDYDDGSKSIERSAYDLDTKKTFQKYYQEWDKEIQFVSSIQTTFENNNYQEIIKMGWNAVPHIINQLRKDPHHLFWALERITGAYPIRPGHVGHLKEMAADWIEWYDKLIKK